MAFMNGISKYPRMLVTASIKGCLQAVLSLASTPPVSAPDRLTHTIARMVTPSFRQRLSPENFTSSGSPSSRRVSRVPCIRDRHCSASRGTSLSIVVSHRDDWLCSAKGPLEDFHDCSSLTHHIHILLAVETVSHGLACHWPY
jgi:hypothetical protein